MQVHNQQATNKHITLLIVILSVKCSIMQCSILLVAVVGFLHSSLLVVAEGVQRNKVKDTITGIGPLVHPITKLYSHISCPLSHQPPPPPPSPLRGISCEQNGSSWRSLHHLACIDFEDLRLYFCLVTGRQASEVHVPPERLI